MNNIDEELKIFHVSIEKKEKERKKRKNHRIYNR